MEAKRREEIKDQIEMLLDAIGPIKIAVTDPVKGTSYYLKNAEGETTFNTIDEVPIKVIDRLMQKGMEVEAEAFQLQTEQNKKEELQRNTREQKGKQSSLKTYLRSHSRLRTSYKKL